MLFLSAFTRANILTLPESNVYAVNTIALSDNDRLWLAKKQTLTIGLYGPLNPPLSLVDSTSTLAGINSDYLLLLKNTLKVNVVVKYYSSHQLAMVAIKKGEVDLLLSSLTEQKFSDKLLTVSTPLLYSYPSLVTRKDESMKALHTDKPVTVAIAGNYPDRDFILSLFKHATIIEFDDVFQALSSVNNGESEFYLGNNLEAGYYLSFDFYHSLNMVKTWGYDSLTTSFIMDENKPELHRVVNSFIGSLTPVIQNKIVEPWIDFGSVSSYSGPLSLTSQEKKWIEKNKKLRVVINPYHFPFTMVDANLDIRGVTGDMLDLIHIKTGLDFEPVLAKSSKEMMDIINKGNWDLHPATTYSDVRKERVLFSHSFLSTPFVIVVKEIEKGNKFPDMKQGMRIAIPPQHTLGSYLKSQYPAVKFIEVENSTMAINMLGSGKVDAAVSTKLTASYYIEHYAPGELYYYLIPNIPQAEIAFALPGNAYELRGILNKVIDDTPRKQIARLSDKWLYTPNISVDTWYLYKDEFYLVILFSTLLIVSSLFWGMYLQKQIRMRKKSERNLQEQLNFSSTLSSSIPLPLYVITLEGELTKFNPAFSSFFATKIQPEPGMLVSERTHPLYSVFNTLQQDVMSGLNNNNIVSYDTKIHNGIENRYVIHWFTLFETQADTPPLLICGWRDITESKILTDALIIESAKAIDAKQAKGVFLARMSHELRTPVSAILGFLELIRLENKSTDIKDSNIELAYATGQSLLHLIGDILDVEKIESGNFDIHSSWIDFESLLTSSVKMFDALSFKKGLEIFQQNDITHKYHLWLDPQAVRQVLANLIGNAIKFTDQGSINITASLTSEESDDAILVINVSDSGPGIPDDEQEKLFQPFSQTASGKLKVGSGLGLSICYEIIGLMGGRIFISKSSHQGTTFTIEIPTRISEVVSSHRPLLSDDIVTISNNIKLNVLVADDNPTNLLLIRRQLAILGITVDEVSDGRQALEAICRKSYDLLITDINMPYLDGVELAQKLRTFNTEILIWGLTANASEQERDRCLEAGLDLLLFKPVNLQKLENLLQMVKPRAIESTLDSIIDIDALSLLTMGDPTLMHQILTHARDESEYDLHGIQHALTSNDWAVAKHHLHRLAGTAQILGATAIVQRCETFKQHLHAESESTSIQSEMDELILQLEQLFSSIDRFKARSIS